MNENQNFFSEKANNRETKVCLICGERHPFEKRNLPQGAFFIIMTCPVENVKLGGRTTNPDNFVFLEKHILK